MKKANIVSLALIAYLIVMAVIGWPGGKYGQLSFTEYFLMIGATIVVIILLRLVQIKRAKTREQLRNKREDKKEES